MSYSNGMYSSRSLERFAYITGTATASGTNSLTGADLKTDGQAPTFVRRTAVTGGKVVANIATPANFTSLKLIVKNGTNTLGSDVVGTMTAAQSDSITVTASNGTFAAGAGPTFVLDGTSTASGQSLGTLVVWLETQELFS